MIIIVTPARMHLLLDVITLYAYLFFSLWVLTADSTQWIGSISKARFETVSTYSRLGTKWAFDLTSWPGKLIFLFFENAAVFTDLRTEFCFKKLKISTFLAIRALEMLSIHCAPATWLTPLSKLTRKKEEGMKNVRAWVSMVFSSNEWSCGTKRCDSPNEVQDDCAKITSGNG